MDDIFEHLGIILLIVISVVAQIAKTAKKASKENNAPSSAEMEEHTDGKIIGTLTEIKPKVKKHTPMKTKSPKKSATPSNIDNNSNLIGNFAPQKSKSEVKNSETPTVSIDDFDIRKAIIYSEIMTPKFKEE